MTFPSGTLLAQSALNPAKRLGGRVLSDAGRQHIVGRRGGVHATAVAEASGSTYPWEASIAGANTANGNKLTSIPIVGWTARGGMPASENIIIANTKAMPLSLRDRPARSEICST